MIIKIYHATPSRQSLSAETRKMLLATLLL